MFVLRRRVLSGIVAAVVSCAAAAMALLAQATAAEPTQRISFQILTGSTSGSYFRVGELLAGLLSHPPGISRCETPNLCGPEGLTPVHDVLYRGKGDGTFEDRTAQAGFRPHGFHHQPIE